MQTDCNCYKTEKRKKSIKKEKENPGPTKDWLLFVLFCVLHHLPHKTGWQIFSGYQIKEHSYCIRRLVFLKFSNGKLKKKNYVNTNINPNGRRPSPSYLVWGLRAQTSVVFPMMMLSHCKQQNIKDKINYTQLRACFVWRLESPDKNMILLLMPVCTMIQY